MKTMWRPMAIRGVIAILLGLLAIFWPGMTLGILVILFGAYALVDGTLSLIAWMRSKIGLLFAEGIVGIALGAAALSRPAVIVTMFVYFVAIWALLTGIAEIAAAIALRKMISQEVFLLTAGIVSVIFALLLFIYPVSAIVVLIWLIGIYTIIFGLSLIALAYKLKS